MAQKLPAQTAELIVRFTVVGEPRTNRLFGPAVGCQEHPLANQVADALLAWVPHPTGENFAAGLTNLMLGDASGVASLRNATSKRLAGASAKTTEPQHGIGSATEVGADAAWRMLLQTAQLRTSARGSEAPKSSSRLGL